MTSTTTIHTAKGYTTTIHTATGRAFSGSNQWGYTARVHEADGACDVWDSVAGTWTTCHSLTARQIARLCRLASEAFRAERRNS